MNIMKNTPVVEKRSSGWNGMPNVLGQLASQTNKPGAKAINPDSTNAGTFTNGKKAGGVVQKSDSIPSDRLQDR